MRPRPYPSPAGCMGRPGLSGTVSRERFRHNSGLQEYLQASENCVCQGARRSATTLREAKASDGTASTKRLSVMSATAIERPLRQRLLSVSDRLFAAVFCSRYAPLAYMLTAPVAEAYFFLLSRRFMRRHAAAPHGTHSMDQDATDAIRFWELQAAEDPSGIKPLLRGWFVGEPALEAKRGNLIEFLAWSTFNKTPECCGRAQRAVIDSLLERLETAAGHELAPPGYEPNLKAMTFTLDPWPTSCCKPLVAYLALQIARQLLACFLHAHGFEVRLAHDMLIMGPLSAAAGKLLCGDAVERCTARRLRHAATPSTSPCRFEPSLASQEQRAGRLAFWVRPVVDSHVRPAPPPPPPVVLLHGVLGLLPYVLVLRCLAQGHTGAVLAPMFPHSSMQYAAALYRMHTASRLSTASLPASPRMHMHGRARARPDAQRYVAAVHTISSPPSMHAPPVAACVLLRRLEHICDRLDEKSSPHDATELVAALRTMVARHSPAGSPPRAVRPSGRRTVERAPQQRWPRPWRARARISLLAPPTRADAI